MSTLQAVAHRKSVINVGASLLTAHKNIELLATYNCNSRSKYTSHQGSLKLKILF
ncbi:Cell surface antigen-like protein Sca10 [Rickettsia akari str. Hartford]|uniref:Cell surface antigen-like protein Sca10 n=1 Tax=Rickettsia akari (strain Hartford) TaxID=293614 RepID=A8GLT4_RICAH|nr:Cell surface antigen-like protein Sca10 [Rickettsia akari str. Hartford]